MHVNRTIIIGTLLLTATGAYQVLWARVHGQSRGPTLTRVVIGGYMLAVIASIVDILSPSFGALAGAVLMLSVTTLALTVVGNLSALMSTSSTSTSKSTTSKGA